MERIVPGNRWRVMFLSAILALGTRDFISPVTGQLSCQCPKAFFNFGTSLTDTGNLLNAFPFSPDMTKFADPENPPYGDAFFRRPAKRYCNGRVIPDFFSLAFGIPLLDTYVAPTVFNFSHGVNFAGDRVGDVSSDSTGSPLFLPLQIKQFIRFKSSALTARSQIDCLSSISSLPPRIHFQDGLYTFEFGSSDIRSAVQRGVSSSSIVADIIPAAIQSIVNAVTLLYQHEARNFLIYNVFPRGCSPQILTLLVDKNLTKDDLGCIVEINQLDEAYNSELFMNIQNLRASLPDAHITLFDSYNATSEILRDPLKYGNHDNLRFPVHEDGTLSKGEERLSDTYCNSVVLVVGFDMSSTLTACCGASGLGTYNYNPNVTCAIFGSNKCADPDKYISWDGVHFTESFYRTVSNFTLSGQYSTPSVNYSELCNLNFTNFRSSATYDQVYGRSCSVWYA